mmetsp:Transcript_18876/g.45236  ORF Transcript_18876/g.45236 Transcript_18876/m.45236 type:complete len:245 (-) Transcript_18876:18-752(-)
MVAVAGAAAAAPTLGAAPGSGVAFTGVTLPLTTFPVCSCSLAIAFLRRSSKVSAAGRLPRRLFCCWMRTRPSQAVFSGESRLSPATASVGGAATPLMSTSRCRSMSSCRRLFFRFHHCCLAVPGGGQKPVARSISPVTRSQPLDPALVGRPFSMIQLRRNCCACRGQWGPFFPALGDESATATTVGTEPGDLSTRASSVPPWVTSLKSSASGGGNILGASSSSKVSWKKGPVMVRNCESPRVPP